MRTTSSLLVLLFISFFAFDSVAQEDDKSYVIQIATLGSFEELAEKKEDFSYCMSCFTEKVGKRVKVYQLMWNSEYQSGDFYSSYFKDRLKEDLKYAKERHKGAFTRSDVKWKNLVDVWEVFEEYKNKTTPTEYTAKGGTSVESTTSNEAVKYKIQLGAFKEQKSLDYIADRYGLSETEKNEVEELLTYDFKKIRKVICRRYFFGEYSSKKVALAKKKALEKKTNRKLILVKA